MGQLTGGSDGSSFVTKCDPLTALTLTSTAYLAVYRKRQ